MSIPQLVMGCDEVWARRYQIRRLVGEGSRKRVYLAHDTRLNRDIALALIKSETLEPTGLARVQRETQTMARLGNHSHIVTVYDVGDEEGQPYIVSELMAGGSLADLLRVQPCDPPCGLDLDVVLRLSDHICRALEHAHAHGVIHRDLKPANVWLTADGTAKLGDFGLALARERSRMTVDGMIVGTVAYMAPEQALGGAVDPRSDLYSLGALLYELVTGRPPFVGEGAVAVVSQHLHTPPVAPSWHNARLPAQLEALILQLLEKDPAKRPSSVSVVRDALQRLRAGLKESGTESVPESALSDVTVQASPSTANPLDRLDAGVFVGREQEMTMLRAAVEDALAGRARVVLIAGEPGIGKTRVAQQLGTYAQLRGMQVLWGRCHGGGGAPAFWPWVQAVRTYVHERPLQELRADLGAGAPEIANVVSAVRERLPDLPAPTRLDPDQERFRFLDSVTMFLKRATAHQAIMLVVDDLHWADVPSLLLLQFLVREMESERLVVVATYRDEEAGPGAPVFASLAELARASVSRRLALVGLREPAVAQLIERTAGARPSPALITAVTEQTEGNPFFVGEVVRWLVAQGRFDEAGGTASGVPPSVREVIVRRLQSLSPECNELLSSAAVVGREFPLALLARVRGQSEDMLLELAEEAVGARVLTEVEAGRYSFSHALIRETLYAELTPARRRRLHRGIGEALEALHAARVEQYLPALAYHFREASPDTAEKAVNYAQRAADRSTTLTAYEDAVTYYEQVLHALGLTERPDRLRRAEVLLGLGKAEFGCGKSLEDVRARYLEAANIALELDAPELLARAALEFANGPTFPGAYDASRSRLLEEAGEALSGHGTTMHARLLARLACNRAERARPPEEVGALCDEAIAVARRHEDAEVLSYVLVSAVGAEWRPDSFPRRLEWIKELTALSQRLKNKDLERELHHRSFRVFSRLGDRALLDRAIDAHATVAAELRLPFFLHNAHMLRAMRATMSGRFAEAERCAQDAFAAGRTIQPEFAGVVFTTLMWMLRRERGEFRLEEVEAFSRFLVERDAGVIMRAAVAWLYADLGRVDDARHEYDRLVANDFADVPQDDLGWPSTIGILAEVCAALGDAARAPILYDMLQPYAALGMMIADTICLGATARYLGLLAATMRRWDDASGHFEHALAFNAALGAPPLVARTQYNYAAMLLARGASNDRRRALQLLTPAGETARDLGMKLLLERTLELKLQAQGTDSVDLKSSIDVVATEVREAQPDLRAQSAPGDTLTRFERTQVLRDESSARNTPRLPVQTDAIASDRYVCRHEGDYWTFAYEGQTIRVRHSRGVAYLAYLLWHPGRDFQVNELVDLVAGGDTHAEHGDASLRVTRSIGDAGPVLDRAAREAYRRRVLELREGLADAEQVNDSERASRCQEELEAIAHELRASTRGRRAAAASERARIAVTKGIRTTLTRIRLGHPALARHLEATVKRGYRCSYVPDPRHPIAWMR